jgi:thiamine pyrophosphate-dependent acetolactate synthase large subunit-like protein
VPGYSGNFPQTKLIHVDFDNATIGRNYPPDMGLLADAKAFLQPVLAELDRRRITESGRLREVPESVCWAAWGVIQDRNDPIRGGLSWKGVSDRTSASVR